MAAITAANRTTAPGRSPDADQSARRRQRLCAVSQANGEIGAAVEAKRTSIDPRLAGRVAFYASELEKRQIADRGYQIEAIRRVGKAFDQGKHKVLIVMATGTASAERLRAEAAAGTGGYARAPPDAFGKDAVERLFAPGRRWRKCWNLQEINGQLTASSDFVSKRAGPVALPQGYL